MKRLGHIFAVLAFAFALLVGAAGGAMVQVGPVDHHGSHHAASDSVPSHSGSHKAAAVMAQCCPAAETPAGHAINAPVTLTEASWHPQPQYIPGARGVTPEPHPPKTSL